MKKNAKQILVASLLLNQILPVAVSATEMIENDSTEQHEVKEEAGAIKEKIEMVEEVEGNAGSHELISEELSEEELPINSIEMDELADDGIEPNSIVEASLWDLESLEVSQRTATVGETITYSIKATDFNEIESLGFQIYNIEFGYNEYLYSEYNASTGRFEADFSVSDYIANGEWQLIRIEVTDIEGNYSSTDSVQSSYEDEVETSEILSQYTVNISEGRTDFVGPAINLQSLNVSQNTVNVGETISYDVEATDESQIIHLVFVLYNPISGNFKEIYAEFNETTNKFEAEFSPDKHTVAGEWILANIFARDKYYSSTYIYSEQHPEAEWYENSEILNQFTVEVLGGKTDFTGPVIDLESLSVSQETVKIGETVKYSIKATDESGISYVKIELYHQESGYRKYIDTEYNSFTDKYEGSFTPDIYLPAGNWILDNVEVRDLEDNYSRIYNEESPEASWNETSELLSSFTVNLIDGKTDFSAPIIDLENIDISNKVVKVGESTVLSFNATDENKISKIEFSFYHPESGNFVTEEAVYNDKKEKYEIKFTPENDSPSGRWVIQNITAEDSVGNFIVINHPDGPQDGWSDPNELLSAYSIEVTGGRTDFEGPQIDLETFKASKKTVNAGESIQFSVNITDESELRYTTLTLYHPVTNKRESVTLNFNETTAKYEGNFETDVHMPDGIWKVYELSATDSYSQSTSVSNKELENEYSDSEFDFSKHEFKLTGGNDDFSGPILNMNNIEISSKDAAIGDIIKYSFSLEDESELSESIYLHLKQTKGYDSERLGMYYNPITNKHEGYFILDKYTQTGEWIFDYIEASDIHGNTNHFYNTHGFEGSDEEFIYDFSAYNLGIHNTTIVDRAAPEVDVDNIYLSSKEATLGEEIVIGVSIKDESIIEEAMITLINLTDNRNHYYLTLEYNDSTMRYETTIEVNSFIGSGKWQIGAIDVRDEHWNINNLYVNSDFSDYSFVLVGTREDYEGPTILSNTLKISEKNLGIGDRANFSLEATDESGVHSGTITYRNRNTHINSWIDVSLNFNPKTDLLEGNLYTSSLLSSGDWEIYSIYVMDNNGQYSSIYNSKFDDNGDVDYQDLSRFDLKITATAIDMEAPELYDDTLKVSSKTGKKGDSIKYSMEVTDNQTIDEVLFLLQHNKTGKTEYLYASHNPETNHYESTFEITENVFNGKWEIIEIIATDAFGNISKLSNNKYHWNPYFSKGVELSKFDLEVSGANSDLYGPIIHADTLNISHSSATKGDKVLYSLEVTDESAIEEVTITLRNVLRNESDNEDITLSYNNKTKRYEGYFNVDNQKYSGKWFIASISALDKHGNDAILSSVVGPSWPLNLHNINAFALEVYGTQPDFINPKILMNSFKIDKQSVKNGDTVTYSVAIQDQSEIVDAYIYIGNTLAGANKLLPLKYNKETDLYEAILEVSEKVYNGNWEIHNIVATDKFYNTSYLTGEANEMYGLMYKPWSKYDVKVNNSSTVIPKLIYEEFSVESKTVSLNDSIMYTFGAVGFDETASGRVYIYNEETKTYKLLPITFNTLTKKFEGKFEPEEQSELGKWEVTSVEVYNDYGIHTRLLSKKYNEEYLDEDFIKDMSKLDIEVTKKEESTIKNPTVSYRTHVQSFGWQPFVKDGAMSGTSGQAKRLEGIEIKLDDLPYAGGIEYQTHVQSYGWMNWAKNGTMSGTSGEAKRLEGIRIKLTGELAKHYDVYYRVHAESFGWLDWTKNGEASGTEGLAKRLEGIEVQLVKKGEKAPGATKRPYILTKPSISYTTHVQKDGWQAYVKDGQMAGTSGRALRLEGIKMQVSDPTLTGGIEYRTHVQKIGWQNWKANDDMSGTSGQALRLEAIEIRLTGELAKHYDVYYRVHAQSYGWLGWAKSGESSGTEGLGKRLEGIEVRLVRKGGKAPGSTIRSYVKK